MTTVLSPDDRLPLTCTREGTCCHGKVVWVNPWEIASLAHTLGRDQRHVRDSHTVDGGIRLRFDGEHRWRDQPACSLYQPGQGCSAHAGRPLACRLFPLGRERQGDSVRYLHEGAALPCLDACPAVIHLPKHTVGAYLTGQGTGQAERVQDAYLEVVQDLAEAAFVLLFDSDIASRIGPDVVREWRQLGLARGEARARRLGRTWLDRLTIPEINPREADTFVVDHRAALDQAAQTTFGALNDAPSAREACVIMVALALHLGQSLGADPKQLSDAWVSTALANGITL